ncbi:Pycsar system effector family protein [Nitrosospira sp. NpAV]|uniref:Pycsar system effector family protein n=1 Tax=Nitrosospira sp. NpAV TaxID=58133 RepID=UPI0005A2206B|nr:Pycsar system effector family protein [Nitrosospira sp. NpAV]KIO48338.1 hypothetical protein SQ11_11245 [Nitrosospira sp. NpAV]
MNDKERLTTAQWVLERNLAWIAAAEVKLGIMITLQLAMIGGLATVFGGAAHKTTCSIVFTCISGTLGLIALCCAVMVAIPRLNGTQRSLLFFGEITKHSLNSYTESFCEATDAQLLIDWITQIHRNAEIARDKHKWIRYSIIFSFCSFVPWVIALFLLQEIGAI